jgi:RNA polymerase sigma-70 factor (ECF subfamily)
MTDAIQTEITRLRPQLLRFAALQLRSAAAAEDAVQDALLAAFANAANFSGAASVKTWVFAILRNKIIDEIRRRLRAPELTEAVEIEATLDEEFDQFNAAGHWAELPSAWGDPAATLEQKRFWQIFEICLEGLPEKPGRVFMMREFLGLETEEICKELKIGSSNCWVLLHRARAGLRLCLMQRWFVTGGGEGV